MLQATAYPIVYRPSMATRAVLGLLTLLLLVPILLVLRTGIETVNVGAGMIMLFLLLMFVVLVINTLASKIVFHRDRIERVNLLGSKSIAIRDILGYRRGNKGLIVLCSTASEGKGFQIPGAYAYDETFKAWLNGLRNLDDEDAKAAELQIEKDERYGVTPEDRRQKVAWLRRVSMLSALGMMAVMIWAIVYPRPGWLAAGLPIVLPWVAIAAVASSRGMLCFFELDKVEAKKKGNLSTVITMPALTMYFMLTMPGNGLPQLPQEWKVLIVPAVVGGLLISMLMLTVSKPVKSSAAVWLLTMPCMVLYSGETLAMMNGLLDIANPKFYHLVVQRKHNTTGKGATYWFETIGRSDEHYDGPTSLQVSPRLYRRERVNDTVCVSVHPGAFHWRWHSVESCN